MKRYFRGCYGERASITVHRDGSSTLSVSIWTGRIHKKTYATERGARIALGRLCDIVTEVKR